MSLESERKSLMLDKNEYDRISSLAKRAGVNRPVVIMAMLDLTDSERLLAKLQEYRAKQKVEAAEDRKKRQKLAKMAENLSMEQISALMEKLNVG